MAFFAFILIVLVIILLGLLIYALTIIDQIDGKNRTLEMKLESYENRKSFPVREL